MQSPVFAEAFAVVPVFVVEFVELFGEKPCRRRAAP